MSIEEVDQERQEDEEEGENNEGRKQDSQKGYRMTILVIKIAESVKKGQALFANN